MSGTGNPGAWYGDADVPLTIGFLDENGSDEYHSHLLEGIAEAAAHHHARVVRVGHFITNDTNRDPAQVKKVQQFLHQFPLDGILFLGWHRAVTMENEESFRRRFADLPLYSVGSLHEDVPAAWFDSGPLLEELLTHLLDNHALRRIAFISPFMPDGRIDVYQHLMRQRGLLDASLIVQESLLEGLSVPERGRRAVQILLDERNARPDAIMSLYNTETDGVLKELSSRGIRVPEDLAVTSFEDGEVGRYSTPSYTTILFPWRELGRVACDLFLTRLEQERKTGGKPAHGSGEGTPADAALSSNIQAEDIPYEVRVPGRFIIRESCGCGKPEPMGFPDDASTSKSLLDLSEREWRTLADTAGEVIRRTGLQRPDFHLLMRGFLRGLQTGNRGLFLREMEGQLDFFEHSGTAVEPAPILEVLRNAVLPHVDGNPGMLLAAEDMILQAHALLAERALKVWGSKESVVKRNNWLLEVAGQKIVSQYTLKELSDALEESLVQLGIPDCLVVLFDARQGAKDRFARCTPAFYLRKGVRADETMLLPGTTAEILATLSPEIGPVCAMANLLHVEQDFHGFVLYGPGPMDERIYRALSFHISTALSGIFLKERLERSFKRLVDNAHKEGMHHAANGILHNIRNVLGSVEATAHRMQETVQSAPLGDFNMVSDMLDEQGPGLQAFLASDPRAAKLVQFLLQLQTPLESYAQEMSGLSNRLHEKNRLIREILTAQHNGRTDNSLAETCDMSTLVEEALELEQALPGSTSIRVDRIFRRNFTVSVVQSKLIHVLVNLLKNAREAMAGLPESEREVTVELDREGGTGIVRIRDKGIGIRADQLTAVFSHGHTTKKDGHGYGLHASANDIGAMGGTIRAESSGPGKGACFVLTLPIREPV